jgi:hypothetical protein
MSGCRRVEEGNYITVVMKGLRIWRMWWRRRVEGGSELVPLGFSVFWGEEL